MSFFSRLFRKGKQEKQKELDPLPKQEELIEKDINYVEENENTKSNDLKVDSLDDLFEDDDIDEKDESKTETNNKSNIQLEENNPEESKKDTQLLDFDFSDQETNKFKKAEDTAPILPQDDENEVFSVDVQKELEAKFDELFGPIDDDN